MGRPRAVVYKNIHLYDKLHSKKTKMMCGIENTTLYLMKETAKFFVSTEVWAYCASKTKLKKPVELKVDLPVITNQKTIDFLDEHAWHDWIERNPENTDINEALAYLKRVYPDKKAIMFYELDGIIGMFVHGGLQRFDENGNPESLSEHNIDEQKYYNQKYNRRLDIPEIKAAKLKWTSEKNEKLSDKYLDEYHTLEREYGWKHNNLTDVFLDIGQNSICFPVAFSDNTAEWSKEKYGKLLGYAHAGEIFFVSTPDTIYFEIKRHF